MEINKKEFDNCIDSFIDEISSKKFILETIKEYKVLNGDLETNLKDFIESCFTPEVIKFVKTKSNIIVGFKNYEDSNYISGITINTNEKLYGDDHIFNSIEIYFNDDQRKRFNDAIYKIYSIIYFIRYKVVDILIDNDSFLGLMIDLYDQESDSEKQKLNTEYYFCD